MEKRLRYAILTSSVFLILLLMSIMTLSQKKGDIKDLLEKGLEEKEVIIWYLGHSGWAIRTKNHFVIFDYVEMERKPSEPSLANGHINPLEIRNQNVCVFVTHEHSDHYSQSIFNWKKAIKNINYISGWQIETDSNYRFMEPRKREEIEDIEILTINSTDSGVGFLVKIDGLIIFHAGDHAHWGGSMEPFTKEIDYLVEREQYIDVAFFAIVTGTGQRRKSITEGVFYAMEKLKLKVVFPMHAGGKEHLYEEFAHEAEKKKNRTNVHYAKNKGDVFFYKNGRIK